MSLVDLRSKLILAMGLGLLVVVGLMVYADLSKVLQVLGDFRWGYLPAILGLTLLNYGLRFIKWHYYLGQVGERTVSLSTSFLLFFSGLSMVVTPGKVGEWLKSYLLSQVGTTPFMRSAPIIIAERLTDGLALLLLATAGLFLFSVGWPVVGMVLVPAGGIVFLSQNRPLALRLLSWGERVPFLSRRMASLFSFYESAHTLFGLKNLSIGVGLGLVSWLGECMAFYLVFRGLGVGGEDLLVQATFILSISTIGGSLLLAPGGLGVAEAGLTGLSQVVVGLPREMAVAAALLIRLCTLWFGVSLGLVALIVITRQLSPASPRR